MRLSRKQSTTTQQQNTAVISALSTVFTAAGLDLPTVVAQAIQKQQELERSAQQLQEQAMTQSREAKQEYQDAEQAAARIRDEKLQQAGKVQTQAYTANWEASQIGAALLTLTVTTVPTPTDGTKSN